MQHETLKLNLSRASVGITLSLVLVTGCGGVESEANTESADEIFAASVAAASLLECPAGYETGAPVEVTCPQGRLSGANGITISAAACNPAQPTQVVCTISAATCIYNATGTFTGCEAPNMLQEANQVCRQTAALILPASGNVGLAGGLRCAAMTAAQRLAACQNGNASSTIAQNACAANNNAPAPAGLQDGLCCLKIEANAAEEEEVNTFETSATTGF